MEISRTAGTELSIRMFLYPTASAPMRMSLQYAVHDPYAVRAAFYLADSPTTTVQWVLSRDVLIDGLTRHTGHGDIRVWPGTGREPDALYIALGPARESAFVQAPYHAVELFLERTQSLVPLGTEHQQFDIDAELASLLPRS